MNNKILVIDDSPEIRTVARSVLQKQGYTVLEADSGAAVKQMMPAGPAPDLILLDLRLGDVLGTDLLPPLKQQWPRAEVIIITGYATIEAAVTATKLGAYGFLEKPFDMHTLLLNVERALEHRSLREQADNLRKAVSALDGKAAPVFQSAGMKGLLRTVEKIAPSNAPILIVGESGAGKEVLAEMIHNLSPRAQAPFVKVNCPELPKEWTECELFGAEKGSIPGFAEDRQGYFRRAANGTLILDGITEMPVEMQVKLLGVLQDGSAHTVGGQTSYAVHCRIIAITNQTVPQAIRSGKLREDLYYRISAITLAVPPLRERREDIMPLANSFLQRFAAQAERGFTGFSDAAAKVLHDFDWPGNVRQLQNEIQRVVLMASGSIVQVEDLSIVPRTSPRETEFGLVEAMERKAIIQALKATGGNLQEAARRLGFGCQTLTIKIKAYGVKL